MDNKKIKTSFAGTFAHFFINSKLTPLLMVAFLLIGIYTTYLTPREEEPQIDIPIADIFIGYPGASSKEVESKVTQPLEKILTNVKGVEYVYSQSMPNKAMVIVQFYVGEDIERSLVKLYNEIMKHMDQMPQSVSFPLIKTRSIDDVPILALTLWSENYDDFQLKRVAQELTSEIEKVNDVASTKIIGGRDRQIKVELNQEKMVANKVDPLIISEKIKAANKQLTSGYLTNNDKEFIIETGPFLKTVEDVSNLIIDLNQGKPVYLYQVANISDGPSLPGTYVSFSYGKGSKEKFKTFKDEYPAVTISIAKKSGADAMRISDKILAKVNDLKATILPPDIHVDITRNYGETASEKVSELLTHLLGAILAVTIIVMLAMGWRGGLVVFISVPITFALTLFSYYFLDYTLNRITLFALVFVTGIVVDDSIIIAENMHRHFKMKKMPFYKAALYAIDEVGNPTILATFTVIAAVLPMVFVSGMMGPYMSPMPIGASIAMIFSLIIAFMITPWLAFRLLKHNEKKKKKNEKIYKLENTLLYRWYNIILLPMLENTKKRWIFISVIFVLLMASMSLFMFKLVTVKILPFDNKNEFQIVIDMPEGTSLERSALVTKEIAAFLQTKPMVLSYENYVGTSAPVSFNGLVRHYDLRSGSNVADIHVNLLHKNDRNLQSHEIAKSLRSGIQNIAKKYNANVKIVEVPPGPPVLSTMVAEIYGPDYNQQILLANQLKKLFETTPNVVDIDWMVEDDQVKYKFNVDKEKALLYGVSPQQVVNVINMGLMGNNVTQLYAEKDHEQIDINLRLEESNRTKLDDLKRIHIMSNKGHLVAISDLVIIEETLNDKSIFRKNQKRVVYVTADIAGKLESPVYSMLDISERLKELKLPKGYKIKEYYKGQPFLENDFGLKWDGEWQITYEVFRDLGTAFAVVLLIIYLLIVGWFQNVKVPFVMMVSIPLSLVGIILGHWIFGAFFTATSMIGMIALAGIMVRNSILLIDFINICLADKVPLKTAIIEAGAVRTRPILLTAGTVVIGAMVILFDPIFQGLAISLIGGSIASTFLTLIIVPLVFYMSEKRKYLNDNKTISEKL